MANSLDTLYNLRTNFLVVGLTGRIGSGCTTVAHLLSNSFPECKFPLPLNRDFTSNEERKYRIVYSFMENNWNPFILIRASDIITAVLLENELDSIVEYLSIKYKKTEDFIRSLFHEQISTEHGNIADEFKYLKEEYSKVTFNGNEGSSIEEVESKKRINV